MYIPRSMCSREQDLVGVAAGEVIKLSKERQLTCAARKHLLFEFSLYLSRACLGKNDHFENESTVNKWRQRNKDRFWRTYLPGRSRRSGSRRTLRSTLASCAGRPWHTRTPLRKEEDAALVLSAFPMYVCSEPVLVK